MSGWIRHAHDARSDHEVDYARVVHSGAFRRLQGKTQILSLGDDDFYRTRLTHSLEVAQIAEGIVQQLRAGTDVDGRINLLPPAPLIQAIGLAHDIGHPPFGHGGELALNYCMREAGGFEGNAQTLRLLTQLENFSESHGADLTRRALLGVLKYPAARKEVASSALVPALIPGATTIRALDGATARPPKACYDEDAGIIDWILAPLPADERGLFQSVEPRPGHGRTRHKSLDCSIMDAADDIAYGVHDLEDAIALGFVSEDVFRAAVAPAAAPFLATLAERPLVEGGGSTIDALLERLFGSAAARKGAIGRLVHYFIRSIVLKESEEFAHPLLRCRARIDETAEWLLGTLQTMIATHVIDSPRVQHLEFKGQQMVIAVFEAIQTDPRRLLPAEAAAAFAVSGNPRILCDMIANLTDAALQRTYQRLFSPGAGSVFDRI